MLSWTCLSVTSPLLAADYADHPAAQAVIDELVTEEGMDRAALEAVLAQAEKQESILKAIARPAEKTKPWYDYRKIFVTYRHRRRYPHRRILTPVVDALALALDIDTEEEARERGGRLGAS